MNKNISDILNNFRIEGAPVSCERYGSGHINETYIVETDAYHRYILQKLSTNVFKDIPALMENVCRVTEHMRGKVIDPRGVETVIYTNAGNSYLHIEGNYWRVTDFIEDAICLQFPETEEDFYQSAIAFGNFQHLLSDFPVSELHETILDFHNTPKRFIQFKSVVADNPMKRASGVKKEIDFVLSREDDIATLQILRDKGQLPERVTHNDTKLNNVLFDAKTRRALCVIDLDTVMPGLSLYDFGDSIRFGASTAAEDETDLSKVSLNLNLFRIYTRGFLKACPSLTDTEIEMLPMGAKIITFENGLRFLADYLDGDNYYSISRPEHNLDRARTQFKLVEDMEAHWDEMIRIVEEETKLR